MSVISYTKDKIDALVATLTSAVSSEQARAQAAEQANASSVTTLNTTLTAAIGAKYTKPGGGIPGSDLATGVLSGKADLVSGTVPRAQLPNISGSVWQTVANQAAMLAIAAPDADTLLVVFRADTPGYIWFLNPGLNSATLANWQSAQEDAAGAAAAAQAAAQTYSDARSINGKTGHSVTLAAADVNGSSGQSVEAQLATKVSGLGSAAVLTQPTAPVAGVKNRYTTTRTVTDGVLNSTTTVTSATAAFTTADTGKVITGTGIVSGTTLTYVNATTCTLSAAATATATGVTLTTAGPQMIQLPALSGLTASAAEYWVGHSSTDAAGYPLVLVCTGADAFEDGATIKTLIPGEYVDLIVVTIGGTKYWTDRSQGLSRPAADNRFSPIGNRVYGTTGGRTPYGVLDKYNGTQTNIATYTNVTVTYPNPAAGVGVDLSAANSITIPAGAGGPYSVQWTLKFSGTSGTNLKSLALRVNGSDPTNPPFGHQDAYLPSGNVQVNGSVPIWLNDGDVVTLQASVTAANANLDGTYVGDSTLTVTRTAPHPDQAHRLRLRLTDHRRPADLATRHPADVADGRLVDEHAGSRAAHHRGDPELAGA